MRLPCKVNMVLDIVISYIDPIELCTVAQVSHHYRELVLYERKKHIQNPANFIGKPDSGSTVSENVAIKRYELSRKDLNKLPVQEKCCMNYYDTNQVKRLGFAKQGGPFFYSFGNSRLSFKREMHAEKLRKKLKRPYDEKWTWCMLSYRLGGKGGLAEIRKRLARYDVYEKIKSEFNPDLVDETYEPCDSDDDEFVEPPIDLFGRHGRLFALGNIEAEELRRGIGDYVEYIARIREFNRIAPDLLNLRRDVRRNCMRRLKFRSVEEVLRCQRIRDKRWVELEDEMNRLKIEATEDWWIPMGAYRVDEVLNIEIGRKVRRSSLEKRLSEKNIPLRFMCDGRRMYDSDITDDYIMYGAGDLDEIVEILEEVDFIFKLYKKPEYRDVWDYWDDDQQCTCKFDSRYNGEIYVDEETETRHWIYSEITKHVLREYFAENGLEKIPMYLALRTQQIINEDSDED